jgi:hypothetical protein
MRLKNSRISNSDDLLGKLRWAVAILGGRDYLTPAPQLREIRKDELTPQARARALIVVSNVRRAINRCRSTNLDALVRVRNLMMWTGALTLLFVYAILAIAVVCDVGEKAVASGVAFYVVGALVGLFNQLRSDSGSSAPIEGDFGLARARLYFVPVHSGIAAVLGVLFSVVLSASLDEPVLDFAQPPVHVANIPAARATDLGGAENDETPGGQDAGDVDADDTETGDREIPPLPAIFDLQQNRFGLLVAAIFGLTPGLLVSRLQGQANQISSDLRSVTATDTTGT